MEITVEILEGLITKAEAGRLDQKDLHMLYLCARELRVIKLVESMEGRSYKALGYKEIGYVGNN